MALNALRLCAHGILYAARAGWILADRPKTRDEMLRSQPTTEDEDAFATWLPMVNEVVEEMGEHGDGAELRFYMPGDSNVTRVRLFFRWPSPAFNRYWERSPRGHFELWDKV
jgi:hypothetical protein